MTRDPGQAPLERTPRAPSPGWLVFVVIGAVAGIAVLARMLLA